ncbi:MAG: PspC domain-containing protein [Nocardioidaceae bacterium]|nr:PspC domain-containing protein [Nocardioidaceae bacterium]
MSSTSAVPAGKASSGAAATAAPPVRRAYRLTEGQLVGGVASGLARHLGMDPFWARLAFVVGSWLSGFGLLVYVVLWRLLPQQDGTDTDPAPDGPAGVAAATRLGMRTPAKTRRRSGGDVGQAVALLALGVGVILLQSRLGWGLDSRILWPALIATAGLALLWRQGDEAQRQHWRDAAPGAAALAPLLGGGGWAAAARLVAGAALLASAIGLFIVQSGGLSVLSEVLTATLLALIGLGLLVGPWVQRLISDLATERRERVRSQERADMAAHLHDSVLQTLALLQRHADDPRAVSRLARRQERELRSWLYEDDTSRAPSLCVALTTAAAEIEDRHDVAIEVVCVGDAVIDEATTAVIRAASEAMVNAARHSGASTMDVYAEVTAEALDVFVRDRGVGFDPAAVPQDRMGVRRSIIGRMQRHRGAAEVRSAPGEGTEIRLSVQRKEAG